MYYSIKVFFFKSIFLFLVGNLLHYISVGRIFVFLYLENSLSHILGTLFSVNPHLILNLHLIQILSQLHHFLNLVLWNTIAKITAAVHVRLIDESVI